MSLHSEKPVLYCFPYHNLWQPIWKPVLIYYINREVADALSIMLLLLVNLSQDHIGRH